MSACSRLSSCNLMMQVSYAIGVAQPLSVHVDTYGTGNIPDKEILQAVLKNFDFRPGKHVLHCMKQSVLVSFMVRSSVVLGSFCMAWGACSF